MKKETDINLKARFYAQYIGQKVIEGSEYPLTMWDLPAVVTRNMPLSLKIVDKSFVTTTELKLNGYVMQFEKLTVDELIAMGWVKIIEK